MNAERAFDKFAAGFAAVRCIDGIHDDRDARKFPYRVGRAQDLVAKRSTLFPETRCLGPQHQVREVHIPLMRWDVRAFRHVAHVTEVAVIDNVPIKLLRYAIDFHRVRLIDCVE